jgi:hypothetical protein
MGEGLIIQKLQVGSNVTRERKAEHLNSSLQMIDHKASAQRVGGAPLFIRNEQKQLAPTMTNNDQLGEFFGNTPPPSQYEEISLQLNNFVALHQQVQRRVVLITVSFHTITLNFGQWLELSDHALTMHM